MLINNNNYVITINVVQNNFCNKSELNNKSISIQNIYSKTICFTMLLYYVYNFTIL